MIEEDGLIAGIQLISIERGGVVIGEELCDAVIVDIVPVVGIEIVAIEREGMIILELRGVAYLVTVGIVDAFVATMVAVGLVLAVCSVMEALDAVCRGCGCILMLVDSGDVTGGGFATIRKHD